MALEVSDDHINRISLVLQDQCKPLKERFRALFTLKNINTLKCINEIGKCFKDPSALLKHELAYCLGQMQDENAIPILVGVLEDDNQETIVRHEAGEAIGAIGSREAVQLLEKYSTHEVKEIAETCQLALDRINWLHSNNKEDNLSKNPYASVDPAPPMQNTAIEELTELLLNEKANLFERYRAMFTLRNMGNTESVLALCKGFNASSALFRHEIAFVLGQMSHPAAINALKQTLERNSEHGMVRHECAEALGSIATGECFEILQKYAKDDERVVKESCDIALDMCEYENSDQFQYADGLVKANEQ